MEHDRLKVTRIDLLSELHSPSFWRNVASINRDLAAYSSEKPGDIPPGYHPDKLTQDFSTCYFDPQYLGETATVTIAHELPDGGLGIEQTNGELGPFTHATVSAEECVAGVDITTEQRVVALAIGEKMIINVITACMKFPTISCALPTNTDIALKSIPPRIMPMTGPMISDTSELTIAVNAPPIIMPTAMLMSREIGERRVGKECRSRWSPYH